MLYLNIFPSSHEMYVLGKPHILLSTTTITEGVNTSAKNLIVAKDTKGGKPLKKFDAQNISGRAGRFLQHYKGRVIVLNNHFMKILSGDGEIIKHKNYDKVCDKDDVDVFFTKREYLTTKDRAKKLSMIKEQRKRNLPNHLFKQYKTISYQDKITVFDNIKKLTKEERIKVDEAVNRIYTRFDFSWSGFEIIFNSILKPIIKNKKLLGLINGKSKRGDSILIICLNTYIKYGYGKLVEYEQNNKKATYDVAMRRASNFVYNTLKYHVVKYLGIFDIMYKYIVATENNCNLENVAGIDRLLIKLEYNAFSEFGRIASDYGVSTRILDYYENIENNPELANEAKNNFDDYEKIIFNKVEEIVPKIED